MIAERLKAKSLSSSPIGLCAIWILFHFIISMNLRSFIILTCSHIISEGQGHIMASTWWCRSSTQPRCLSTWTYFSHKLQNTFVNIYRIRNIPCYSVWSNISSNLTSTTGGDSELLEGTLSAHPRYTWVIHNWTLPLPLISQHLHQEKPWCIIVIIGTVTTAILRCINYTYY